MANKSFFFLFVYLFSGHCMAQSMTVSGGNWVLPTISAVSEAGNNYASTKVTSASNQSLISITMPSVVFGFLNNHYTVNIKRTDSGSNWDTAGLQIWVKRTGNGTGGGSSFLGISTIVGGNSNFQQINSTDSYFFEGDNYGTTPRSNVPIQYQIEGISVLVPVGSYSTTITYTLIDN